MYNKKVNKKLNSMRVTLSLIFSDPPNGTIKSLAFCSLDPERNNCLSGILFFEY
jgi:hypothetical protein